MVRFDGDIHVTCPAVNVGIDCRFLDYPDQLGSLICRQRQPFDAGGDVQTCLYAIADAKRPEVFLQCG